MPNGKSKIIIIGFGSIGQRHFRNLKALGYENVAVFDPYYQGELREKEKETFVSCLDKETLKDFQVAFICSPNNWHIKHAMLAAQAGCHLFIEKPLSHNLKDIDKLENICQKNKLTTMIGCNMRFHPCLSFLKKIYRG